jgi:hypothetical protein
LTVTENPAANYTFGFATGACKVGSYNVKFSDNGGWVNTVTMAEYLTYSSSYTIKPGAVYPGTSLTMFSGATTYVALFYTGGAFPLYNATLTTVNEEIRSQIGGETDVIGQQSNNTLSFTTSAHGYGIVALGVWT